MGNILDRICNLFSYLIPCIMENPWDHASRKQLNETADRNLGESLSSARPPIESSSSKRSCPSEAAVGRRVKPRPPSSASYDEDAGLNINSLPHSILIHVFRGLSVSDRQLRAALVCSRWNELTRDADLWRDVDVSRFPRVDDDVLRRLCGLSERVTAVNVNDCSKVTDEGLEDVLKTCIKLEKLSMARCQQLKRRAFQSIADHGRRLKVLNLSCCFALNDEDMSLIAAGCVLLESVSINQCSRVSDVGIVELGRFSRNLTSLSVDQCSKITDCCLKPLVEGCPRLKSLSCKDCKFTASGVESMSNLHELVELDVSSVRTVTDAVVVAIVRGCPSLEVLNLSLCVLVTNVAVEFIAERCQRLHSLYLVSCSINDDALVALSRRCKSSLRRLDVAWCNDISDDGAVLLSDACHRLRYFGLMRCDRVSVATTKILVEKHPLVHYSTMWLDCRRVLERARDEGFTRCGELLDGLT